MASTATTGEMPATATATATAAATACFSDVCKGPGSQAEAG
jgi:hypothetical protein